MSHTQKGWLPSLQPNVFPHYISPFLEVSSNSLTRRSFCKLPISLTLTLTMELLLILTKIAEWLYIKGQACFSIKQSQRRPLPINVAPFLFPQLHDRMLQPFNIKANFSKLLEGAHE
jgi:hypothetical protein